MDGQRVTLLVLLDLSAAFDTVDHDVLHSRLSTDFGIKGTALKWFESYLSNRRQRVSIEGVTSKLFDLDFGVPQGSCLGTLLFLLYSSKLFKIISRHLPSVHAYADDTQLYLSFKAGDDVNEKSAIAAMEACVLDIHKLNGCYLIDSSLTWTKLSSCLLVPSDSWKKLTSQLCDLAIRR